MKIVAALSATLAAIPGSPLAATPAIAWSAVARGAPAFRDAEPVPLNYRAMAVDAAGNTYVTGFASDGTAYNILTIKYDAAGLTKWRAIAPGTATSIAIDGGGNVYVAGSIRNGYSFLDVHDDLQLIKYGADGTELWQASIPANPQSYVNGANAVTVDDAGAVYVTGTVAGELVTAKYDANGARQWLATTVGSGIAITVNGAHDVFVAALDQGSYLTISYDPLGAETWRAVANAEEGSWDSPGAMALDANGDVHVTGISRGLGTNGGIGADRFFTIQYSATGLEQWRALAAAPASDSFGEVFARSIAVDVSGNTYVTGGITGATVGYMTVKYTPTGLETWRAVTPAPSGPSLFAGTSYDIAVDSSGGTYVTGEVFNGTDSDYLTVKYDASGAEVWRAVTGSGTGTDDGASSVRLNSNGELLVAGSTDDGTRSDFLTIKYSNSGAELWRASAGALPTASSASAMITDALGNAYVSGATYRREVRDPSLGPYEQGEALIVKYNAVGSELWRISFDGAGAALAADSTGGVYVARQDANGAALVKYASNGSKQWSASLDAGSTACAVVAIALGAGGDVYVACTNFVTLRFTPAGAILWRAAATAQGGISPESATSLAVDSAGAVYITGSGFASGGPRYFVTMKYDGSGVEQWRTTAPSGIIYGANAMGLDGAGHLYVTGDGGNDYLTIKYDAATGGEVWRRYAGLGGVHFGLLMVETMARALKLDSAGNIYVTGQASRQGYFDYATIKYDPSGVQQWLALATGAIEGDDQPRALAIDAGGNAYVTGQSFNGANFDILTIKYDALGFEQWRLTGNNPLNEDSPVGVALGSGNSVYVAGTSTIPGQPRGMVLQKIVQGAASSIALKSSTNPSIAGQVITLTALVSGAKPTGTVSFHDGSATLCTTIPLSSGKSGGANAKCVTAFLPVGSHSVTAIYSGDSNNAGSVSALLTQVVTPPPPGVSLTSSLNPSKPGDSVTFTARVTGQAPTGTVTFKDGANALCSAVALQGGGNSPVATCTTSTLAKGSHPITAAYSGDANNVATTSPVLTQTVKAPKR